MNEEPESYLRTLRSDREPLRINPGVAAVIAFWVVVALAWWLI